MQEDLKEQIIQLEKKTRNILLKLGSFLDNDDVKEARQKFQESIDSLKNDLEKQIIEAETANKENVIALVESLKEQIFWTDDEIDVRGNELDQQISALTTSLQGLGASNDEIRKIVALKDKIEELTKRPDLSERMNELETELKSLK